MEQIQITDQQFLNFIGSCSVQYDGDSYESNGYLKDPEGNVVASIDYDSGPEKVEGEICLNEDQYFEPTHHQETAMLHKIDEETQWERESVKEMRNEPSCPYQLYGVKPSDFI